MANPHLNNKKTIKKKSAAKIYYSSIKGYKGKGGGQNPKSKSYREKLADKKKKVYRANVRDAARGGFKSVASMEKKGASTRIGQRVKKQTKAELTKLKGRR
jgi:hypothetical protein